VAGRNFRYFSIVARRVLTVAACVFALALPPLNAVAAARAKTVTKVVRGTTVTCKKWGQLQLQLKITQSVIGGKVKSFKILAIAWPVWPQHTVRSVFINQRALPLLQQQVLQLQSGNIETISGATDITVAFKQSLQAALLAAKTA
jgi:uncharacterized protein with FMN-binding domain